MLLLQDNQQLQSAAQNAKHAKKDNTTVPNDHLFRRLIRHVIMPEGKRSIVRWYYFVGRDNTMYPAHRIPHTFSTAFENDWG